MSQNLIQNAIVVSVFQNGDLVFPYVFQPDTKESDLENGVRKILQKYGVSLDDENFEILMEDGYFSTDASSHSYSFTISHAVDDLDS